MDTLVSVLLYLHVLLAGNIYTRAEINYDQAYYAAQIFMVETDPALLPEVMIEYEEDAIWVIDNLGG